jgi:cytochrome P450
LSPARIELARQRFDDLTASTRAAFDRRNESNVPGRLHALGLSFEESRGVIGILVLAGTETMVSALPRIVAMLIDTGQWTALRAKRALVAAAVDEGLRLTAPVAMMTRNVVEPTVLGGRHLKKNDRVVVCLANALKSRDAAVDPLGLDFERVQTAEVSNLWFGHGPHFCLGAALARRELESALNAMLDCGELEIVRRRCAYRTVFPAYAQLVVRRIAPGSTVRKAAIGDETQQ